MRRQGAYTTAPHAHILQISIIAMNMSVDENGLVPMLLVYGMPLRLPDSPGSGPLPQDKRLEVLQTARNRATPLCTLT